MLNVNEILFARDPAEALRDEVGKFEVTSPGGEKFIVICRPGVSITNIRLERGEHLPDAWQIRRVAGLEFEQEVAA